jgi:hypothetical protein
LERQDLRRERKGTSLIRYFKRELQKKLKEWTNEEIERKDL